MIITTSGYAHFKKNSRLIKGSTPLSLRMLLVSTSENTHIITERTELLNNRLVTVKLSEAYPSRLHQ